MTNRFWLLLLLCLLAPTLLDAQDKMRLRESLKKLATAAEDTNKVNLLQRIGWDTSYDDLAVGYRYAAQGLELAQKLNYKSGLVKSYNTIGAIRLDMGDGEGALEAHLEGLRIADSLQMKDALASGYMNIANVYSVQGNKQRQSEYLKKSIALSRELNNIRGLSVSLSNLGNLYYEEDSIASAAALFEEALSISTTLNDPFKTAAALSGLARCAARKGDSKKALLLMQRALAVNDSTGNSYEIALISIDFAAMALDLRNYETSAIYYTKAFDIYQRLNMPGKLQEVYSGLAKLAEATGDWRLALRYTRQAAHLKDSLQSDRVLRYQRDIETFYKLTEKDKDIALLNEQKSSQRILLWVAGGGALLLLLLIAQLVNRNKLRNRSNQQLEQQKTQLELQNATIEEKNKSITDSINYAHRIQTALWPRPQDFEQYLRSGFVLIRPKDIVSGDFYWLSEKDGYIFLATVDCTGHGVPGGFMSMLGSLLLTDIINDKGVTEPAEVLNQLRSRVITALRQTGESNDSKDGMDMVLCRYEKEKRELVYAAANNSFYIISNGELSEYLPDKQPVGYHVAMRPFTQQRIQLEADSTIYTFTDGLADQFGGPAGKKFKYKQLREVLKEIAHLPLDKQEETLQAIVTRWQGSLEQIDDILVIAMRFW